MSNPHSYRIQILQALNHAWEFLKSDPSFHCFDIVWELPKVKLSFKKQVGGGGGGGITSLISSYQSWKLKSRSEFALSIEPEIGLEQTGWTHSNRTAIIELFIVVKNSLRLFISVFVVVVHLWFQTFNITIDFTHYIIELYEFLCCCGFGLPLSSIYSFKGKIVKNGETGTSHLKKISTIK